MSTISSFDRMVQRSQTRRALSRFVAQRALSRRRVRDETTFQGRSATMAIPAARRHFVSIESSHLQERSKKRKSERKRESWRRTLVASLLLLVRHLLLEAWHLLLVAMHLFLVAFLQHVTFTPFKVERIDVKTAFDEILSVSGSTSLKFKLSCVPPTSSTSSTS